MGPGQIAESLTGSERLLHMCCNLIGLNLQQAGPSWRNKLLSSFSFCPLLLLHACTPPCRVTITHDICDLSAAPPAA